MELNLGNIVGEAISAGLRLSWMGWLSWMVRISLQEFILINEGLCSLNVRQTIAVVKMGWKLVSIETGNKANLRGHISKLNRLC